MAGSRARNPHLQGLFGVLLGALAIGVLLWLLHLRRNGLPVDATELELSATSPCMIQAIRQAQAGGHVITYAQLDGLKRRCGS